MNIDELQRIAIKLLSVADKAVIFLFDNKDTSLLQACVVYGFVMGLGGMIYMLSNPYSSFLCGMFYGALGYINAYILSLLLPLDGEYFLANMLFPATIFIFLKHTYESLFKTAAQAKQAEEASLIGQFLNGFTTGFLGKGFKASIMGNNITVEIGNSDDDQGFDEH